VESFRYDSNLETVPFGFLSISYTCGLFQVVNGPADAFHKLKVERVLGLTFESFKSVA
jgi:hypothetical protein